ncbi:MAG: deoxynucleoside kinase [candidate division KSB1 bacterium]|nr:deoxynucleoside kinase [candidate division KSB1 bacterium]MDZ7275012.1 deoxynucleoside kinase [candidate division KSB1 bacterium]MDZ7286539.1 deoxynucleoside kinase [candidate division KSB1 bacterium]MDZ7299297.1 deoxynucleoside kinase [candidate division KSB1 bacterium]MDZ7307363.1 deoxynucleoside kinase [candidate division KSB1 bacterium]
MIATLPSPMQQREAKRHAFVAIAGNIGVGKTTLTRMLAERFGWTVFFEKEVHNPYLADFYKDMSRWAFHSQLFFLKERLKDHLRIQVSETICVQDRTIYEDAEIFAQNLFDRGLMQERDFACYLDLYRAIAQALQPPAVIVYLRASIWTLISRIRHRGRDYEQNIDKEYLAQLNIAYERWIKHAARHHRVFVIETDEHDLLQDREWADGILAEIYQLVADQPGEV